MAEKRKLAQDWRNSYENAQNRVKKIENQIKERLLELCRLFPDALIYEPKLKNTKMYATDLRDDFDSYSATDCIIFIGIIEKWVEAQHPHQQSEIKFE